MLREKFKYAGACKNESTEAEHRGGVARSSDEVSVMDMERRGYIVRLLELNQPEMGGICDNNNAV